MGIIDALGDMALSVPAVASFNLLRFRAAASPLIDAADGRFGISLMNLAFRRSPAPVTPSDSV
jgi:hypothetical protein